MRSRILITVCLLLLAVAGNASEKLPVAAGLPPVAWIAQAIGGEQVRVSSMLPEGRSPHDYAPGPRDIRTAMRAKVFFSTGMVYEERIARALKGRVRVVDAGKNISRIPLGKAHASGKCHHHHHHGCGHDAASGDPHIWLSPVNAAVIAENIAGELAAADPKNGSIYRQRAVDFRKRMESLDRRIAAQLAPFKGKSFFVYHPAFGYIAKRYSLHQVAIELGGREATASRLAAVIKQARQAGVKVVFVQKQFNPASARALASAIGGRVVELDPLTADLEKNFLLLAETLADGFSRR